MADIDSAIDDLVGALSLSGVPFERDAWWDANNTLDDKDYGVVELTGPADSIYGDDQIIMQAARGKVTLYISGRDDSKAKAVQEILISQDIPFRLLESAYLIDSDQTRWSWSFDLEVYLLGEDDIVGT